jgi:nickel-dependent lactate racemase
VEGRIRGHIEETEETIGLTLDLPYGREKLHLAVPDSLDVMEVTPPVLEAARDELAVKNALESPLGSTRLHKLAGDAKSVLVVIPDKTRAAGARSYLPPVLSELDSAGIDRGNVRLITANGSHPALNRAELIEIVGQDIFDRYSVCQHDSKDESSIVELGTTRRGTPVGVNRLCLESDLVVLTGSLSFHYFAGFGGGRKSLFPGLAAYRSMVANHRLTLGPGQGLDSRCGAGVLRGNPVHEDIMEAFSMLPPPFILNTVVAPGGAIVEAFAGSHDPVFEAACSATRRWFSSGTEGAADLVIASCGGFPWDINLLQAHKGLRNAALAARDGGAVVLVAECGQGVGSPTLEEGLRHASWREADEAARRAYVLNAHTAVALLQQSSRVKIHMVSRARELPCAQRWATHHEEPASAYEAALVDLGTKTPFVYHMPLAGITVPKASS